MSRRMNILSVKVALAVLMAGWAIPGIVVAQKTGVPKAQDRLATGFIAKFSKLQRFSQILTRIGRVFSAI
jgi:hypothetical protein